MGSQDVLEQDTYTSADWNPEKVSSIDGASSVMAIVTNVGTDNQEPEVTFEVNHRLTVSDGNLTIEFPAGLVDSKDASLADALRRELKEETGENDVRLENENPIPVLMDPGFGEMKTAIFQATSHSKLEDIKSRTELEDDEEIDLFRLPVSQIPRKIQEIKKHSDYRSSTPVECLAIGIDLGMKEVYRRVKSLADSKGSAVTWDDLQTVMDMGSGKGSLDLSFAPPMGSD